MAYNNVKVKARQVVSQTQQTKDVGIVSPVPMGDWTATTQYQKLNIVRYNGAMYIATAENMGVTPDSNNTFWRLQSKDGRGIQDTEITYQGGVSGTVPPTGEWTTTIPVVPQGTYLWTRTITTYTDGSENTAYSVSLQGLNFTQVDRDDITAIQAVIPSSASATNLLATEAFVNSSLNSMAAFYITYNAAGDAFPTKASLTGATTFYNAGKVRIPTQNDYATVLSDESRPANANGTYPTTRYVYQGGTYPNGQWDLSFVVNSTSFTQAQLNALNSGITSALVTKLNGIETGAQKNPTNYVTIDTTQDIIGVKRFKNSIIAAPVLIGDTLDTIRNTAYGYDTIARRTGIPSTVTYTYTFPNQTGTFALTSDILTIDTSKFVTIDGTQTITGAKTFEIEVESDSGSIAYPFEIARSGVSVFKVSQLNSVARVDFDYDADGDVSLYFAGICGTVGQVLTSNGVNATPQWKSLTSIALALYPIGSIYLSIKNVSPAGLIGGTWVAISSGYALWTTTSQGDTFIGAGLPNITGSATWGRNGSISSDTPSHSGVLDVVTSGLGGGAAAGGTSVTRVQLNFNARTQNTIYGNSSTVQPPAYRVYAWKRTA